MTVGVVVIGRNEGQHLNRCMKSVCGQGNLVVYVDSGSSDNSVAIAHSFGVAVIQLDSSRPFSAARGRNEGFSLLRERYPALEFVQFVDGDCELIADWVATAQSALLERPDVAIVAGLVHERAPEASIYNCLGDMEWNSAGVGEVDAVGGIFMIRCSAMEDTGGFDLTVTAGEEPELCQRLRASSWRILRLDCSMALHDLDMKHFGQWWQRQIRNGRGALDVANRFGLTEYERMTRRARFWSIWLLLIIVGWVTCGVMGSAVVYIATTVVFAFWPAQLARIALRSWRSGQSPAVAFAYAWFTMLSFWPQMLGQWRYLSEKRELPVTGGGEYAASQGISEQQDFSSPRSRVGKDFL